MQTLCCANCRHQFYDDNWLDWLTSSCAQAAQAAKLARLRSTWTVCAIKSMEAFSRSPPKTVSSDRSTGATMGLQSVASALQWHIVLPFCQASITAASVLHVNRAADMECREWISEGSTEERNNRLLQDGGAAHQQLTADDIQELRQSGKSGEEIVSALLQNSATYSGKTQFSQARRLLTAAS